MKNPSLTINPSIHDPAQMRQFVTHVGSALFACPGGIAPGQYIGQRLFEGLKS